MNFVYSYTGKPRFWEKIFGKQILARIIPHGFVCLLFLREAKINTRACSFEFCIQLPRKPRYGGAQSLHDVTPGTGMRHTLSHGNL